MSLIFVTAGGTGGGGSTPTTITLDSQTITDNVASPATASAAYRLDNTGYVNQITSSGGTVQIGQWCNPTANASLYEAFVTITYGTLTGTAGSWLSLGTNRTWTKTVSAAIGYNYVTFTVGIRLIGGDETILASTDIMLEGSST